MQSKLAVQMYTLREFTKTASDLSQSLQRVAAMGYTAVQMSAIGAMNGDTPEVTAAHARKMLDDNGLKCIATHRSWSALATQTEQEIEFHHILGCDFTAIGGLDREYRERGAQGFRDFLSDSAPVIEKLKAKGIRFGYHNHAWEFERFEYRDKKPYTFADIFIDEGNADFLLELDLYWVGHAGVNPQRTVERSVGRMPVIHIKDKEVVNNEPVMAPIGEGNLDWDNLLPACEKAGVEWYAIEQDVCRRDPFDCLRSSFDFLSQFSAK